jgi:hypothetical protein
MSAFRRNVDIKGPDGVSNWVGSIQMVALMIPEAAERTSIYVQVVDISQILVPVLRMKRSTTIPIPKAHSLDKPLGVFYR